jgi:hypothetical protein
MMYRYLVKWDLDEEELNQLGQDGWRLVAATSVVNKQNDYTVNAFYLEKAFSTNDKEKEEVL